MNFPDNTMLKIFTLKIRFKTYNIYFAALRINYNDVWHGFDVT